MGGVMQSNKTVIQGEKITIYGDKWMAFNNEDFLQRAFFSLKSISSFEYVDESILYFRMKYDSQLYFKDITPKDYVLFLDALKI
jgi:hypothetical protein